MVQNCFECATIFMIVNGKYINKFLLNLAINKF